jgi:hypothetical protein
MCDPSLSYLLVDMAQATQTVGIFLEQIRIDGANAQAQAPCIRFHLLPIVLNVPGNMNSDTRTDAHHVVDLCRIFQLFT